MDDKQLPHPEIVSRDTWIEKRKQLLQLEKELTRRSDEVNAQRRRLPMVRVEKEYTFDGAEGKRTLVQLFEGRRQLISYHFMFDPSWEKGCSGCTQFVDALGDLSLLTRRDTTFVLISRAPFEKLNAYRAAKHWDRQWYSSFHSDFNYDYHATLDPSICVPEYNYRSYQELQERAESEPYFTAGEAHGISVFFRIDQEVFHSYSAFARGCEAVTDAYKLLDLTPYGRQEAFEDSPQGWPQRPTYGE